MVGALWTGISGLGGSQTGLDNESNNIANVNTIGYKSSRVSFADQMYQDKIGKGVTSFDVEKMYTQGNLKNTGVSYDMALSGDGFFQVKDGSDTYYTRAGNFRMGEGGTLEDVAQNKVQGWAIQPLTDKDRTATDPNAEFFTNDFTKLLGNKVIRDTSSIETIVAKATDYTTTSVSDSTTVFTGAGYKSSSTKNSDVEALITAYNSALSVYAEADPKPTSSTSSSQKSLLNFPLTGSELAEGDEVYAYIDGEKYSVPFNTDNTTTMKDFADLVSDAGGFTAYLTGDTTSPFDPDTQTAPELGYVVVEGLIPGEQFRVTEFGWTDADNNNQASKGDVVTIAPAVLGTGMGHIDSIRDAMAEAVSGKQMDVFGSGEIALNTGSTVPEIATNKYTYQITIYDNDLGKDVTVPTSPLVLDGAEIVPNTIPKTYETTGYDASTTTLKDAAINEMVNKINLDPELSAYVEAFNFNGNLVVKTKDKNYDVEFTSELKATELVQETQTITINGSATATGTVSFLYDDTTGVTAGDSAATIAGNIETNKAAIMAAWNAENPTRKIADIVQDVAPNDNRLIITYQGTEGNVSEILTSSDNGLVFGESLETQPGRAIGVLAKNPNMSGREGAGAEFLQITTTINQTASKSELQLRLDTLGLTDSAFGDFEVDDTGLVTMTQDGARFAIGQVAIARFTDNRGLEPVGDNLLMETTRSGSALFNTDNDKMAEIKGGTLELSTADLSESLVNLMVFQRAFEANAKSITTADTILTTLIGLKR